MVMMKERQAAASAAGESGGGAASAAPKRTVRDRNWFERNERRWLPVIPVLVILIIWQGADALGISNPLFFSSPIRVWDGLVSLAQGPLWSDLQTSAIEFLAGMGIAIGFGLPLGMLLGSVRRLNYAFDPLITALYSTPILVLMPLFVVWFGLGLPSKVVIVAVLAILPFMINIMEGMQTIDSTLLRAARSFGAGRWAVYKDVMFPSVVPFFVSGLRLAVGKGLIGVVVGEYMAATAGVGFRIRADSEVFNTARLLAGVVIILVVSVVIMALLKIVERKLAPWRTSPLDID